MKVIDRTLADASGRAGPQRGRQGRPERQSVGVSKFPHKQERRYAPNVIAVALFADQTQCSHRRLPRHKDE